MAEPKDAARGCVFCGAKPNSGEHVWPNWLRNIMPDRGKVRYHRSVQDLRTGLSAENDWPGRDYDLTVNCVCNACNTGWMSRLEDKAKPLLQSMAVGNGRDLYATGQRTVAAWTVLKAMMFNGKDRDDPIPAIHHRDLYASRDDPRPPRDTQVWVGAHSLKGVDVQKHFALTADRGGVAETNAYGTTFTVGHLVLQVFGHEVREGTKRNLTGTLAKTLTQVWPVSADKVVWPPELVMSPTDLSTVVNRSFVSG